MGRIVPGAALLLAVAVAAGCGTGDDDGKQGEPACQPADQYAQLISDRLVAGATALEAARAVPLEPPFGNYLFIVAAQVAGADLAGPRPIGVWAVGSYLGGARVMALDATARRYSDWGSAIAGDSAPGKQRSQLSKRREVGAARTCVTRS